MFGPSPPLFFFLWLYALKTPITHLWRQLADFHVSRQQFCGVNVIAYYSSEIFLQANVSEVGALAASLGWGVVNWLFAIPAFYTIDTFGRRNLLLCTFRSCPSSSSSPASPSTSQPARPLTLPASPARSHCLHRPGPVPLRRRLLARRGPRPLHLFGRGLPAVHPAAGHVVGHGDHVVLQLCAVRDVALAPERVPATGAPLPGTRAGTSSASSPSCCSCPRPRGRRSRSSTPSSAYP